MLIVHSILGFDFVVAQKSPLLIVVKMLAASISDGSLLRFVDLYALTLAQNLVLFSMHIRITDARTDIERRVSPSYFNRHMLHRRVCNVFMLFAGLTTDLATADESALAVRLHFRRCFHIVGRLFFGSFAC